jgi:arylsulfatase A-like enzyme
MKKFFTISILMLLTFLAFGKKKPNIVLILADDLRADALGCYGNKYIHTPNIDKLSEVGLSFNNSYIVGGDQGAICSPSRAMLLTGRNFFKNSNVVQDKNTLPKVLRAYGYKAIMTGKWHNEATAIGQNFDLAKNVMIGGMDDHFRTPMSDLNPDGTISAPIRKGYSTDVFCETALEFIGDMEKTKPFFLYLPLTTPHDPRSPKDEFRKLYNGSDMPLVPNFSSLHPFNFGYSMGGRDEFLAPFPRTVETIKDQWADYAAMVTHLDEVVGRVVKTLKEKGVLENTIIIFSSDNGLAMGSHGLMGKQNLYEHSMKIPMIISGPSIPKGQSTNGFVYLMDLFPTICDYLKLSAPKDIDGKSFYQTLIKPKTKAREYIITGYLKEHRSIRDHRYKLIRYPSINHTVLYDLINDPYELINLSERSELSEVQKSLLQKLAQYQKEMGDNASLTIASPLPMAWDYRQLNRVPDKWQPPYILEKYFKKD